MRTLSIWALVALLAWTAFDVLRMNLPRWDAAVQGLLILSVAAFLISLSRWGRWPRRLGMILLVLTYFTTHVVGLGVDIVAGLAFVSLAIVAVELQILSERFVPLYDRILSQEDQRRLDAALRRTLFRFAVAGALAVFVPILAADIAVSGAFGATTIFSAFVLGAAFITIVALLALLPSLGSARDGFVSASDSRLPSVDSGDRPARSRALPSSRRWPGGALVRGRRF